MKTQEEMVEDARYIFDMAVQAVQAHRVLPQALRETPIDSGARVRVWGMGKAALAMAGVLEQSLSQPVDDGVVVVPHGYPAHVPGGCPRPERVAVWEAGHPVPDAGSQRAGRRLRAMASACAAGDTVIVLLSGGGSALVVDPPAGVPLEAVQETVQALLQSGASIQAINAVRKHLSLLKGGQLARRAAPASVRAFVISDVVGDDLSTIASGPTVPDPTTYDTAIAALRQYGVWDTAPVPVRRHLVAGRDGEHPETPTARDPGWQQVHTRVVATNRDALHAAAQAARSRGYAVRRITDAMTGEARAVAAAHVDTLRAQAAEGPVCILWGGEPTVTVTGAGTGGRNQEAALAGALALDGCARPAVMLCGGTDGIDGPTDAAGAWATPATIGRARRHGLDPQGHLEANDAYPFFDALDQLLRPGPTHTNVMDVHIGLVGGRR